MSGLFDRARSGGAFPAMRREELRRAPRLVFSDLDPDALDLGRVAGGFNAVVQIAASPCFEVFRAAFGSPSKSVFVPPPELLSLLNDHDFGSAELRAFRDALTEQGSNAMLDLEVVPRSLEFGAEPRTFSVTVDLSFGLRLGADVGLSWKASISALALIEAEYQVRTRTELAGVDLVADLRQATVSPQLSGDVEPIFAGLLALLRVDLTSLVRARGRIRLAPPISLVGAADDAGLPDASEYEEFSVSAFHLGDAPNRILVAAFDLRRGCRGVIEAVERFLPLVDDYAFVTDEYTVQGVLRYRARAGQFPRAIRLATQHYFHRGEEVIAGTVVGFMSLDSVETAAIEYHANSRSEVIILFGAATLTVWGATLEDGTRLQPWELGNPEPVKTPYSLVTRPTAEVVGGLTADAVALQRALAAGAYRYLAQPFGLIRRSDRAVIDVHYLRLHPSPGYALFIGKIPTDVHTLFGGASP